MPVFDAAVASDRPGSRRGGQPAQTFVQREPALGEPVVRTGRDRQAAVGISAGGRRQQRPSDIAVAARPRQPDVAGAERVAQVRVVCAGAAEPLDRRRGRQDGSRAPAGLDEPADQVLVRLRPWRLTASCAEPVLRAHTPPRPLARKTPAPHVPNDRLRHMLIGYARVSKTDSSQVAGPVARRPCGRRASTSPPASATACEPCGRATCSSFGGSTGWAGTSPTWSTPCRTCRPRGVGLRVLAGQGRADPTPRPLLVASCSASSRRWPSSTGADPRTHRGRAQGRLGPAAAREGSPCRKPRCGWSRPRCRTATRRCPHCAANSASGR